MTTGERAARAQARVDAALANLLANWVTPDGDGAELATAQRTQLRASWPNLAGVVDELVLAVTARSAAEVEALTELQVLSAAADGRECIASDTAYVGAVGLQPPFTNIDEGTAICPTCLLPTHVTRDSEQWLLNSHLENA